MYAVIRTGGKQYRVGQNDLLQIEKLAADVGGTVDFDVLAVGAGEGLVVGTPLVEAAKVVGTVVRHGRARKVTIYKFRRRKNYHRKRGHRQSFTEVRITNIVAPTA